jgi:hypothetical protein
MFAPSFRRVKAGAICSVARDALAAVAALRSLLAGACISICTRTRAFLVLAAVPEEGSEDGSSEFAARPPAPVETVRRFLHALTALGLVEQAGEAQHYRRTRAPLVGCVAERP